MSATEEDTELRDLLIQNLENNGVLNKIKAELRAAVFLALEEQDKVENKTPLVNENLRKCLNTKDGRIVASLITDYLQVFNLDFTLAVFQPEINTLNGHESRESLIRDLGLSESEGNKSTPLLLELIKRVRHKEKTSIFAEGDRVMHIPKDPSPRQIAEARKKFDCRDKDRIGGISKDEVIGVFSELVPNFSKEILERYITDELEAKDRNISVSIDFKDFLGMYKSFFTQCRSVITNDVSDTVFSFGKVSDEKITSPTSKIPRYKGFIKASAAQEEPHGPQPGDLSGSELQGSQNSKAAMQLAVGTNEGLVPTTNPPAALKKSLELSLEEEEEEEEDEGDSFFDDPLPKPLKTYGCSLPPTDKPYSGQRHCEKSFSQKERTDSVKAAGRVLSTMSDPPSLKSAGGSAGNSQRDPVSSKNGTSDSKEMGLQDFKAVNEKAGSSLLDVDLDYDDDFNSHQSENSKSEVSIGEEIEEVSIEGPDLSDKLDEITQDLSVSQLSEGADYMEDVA
ncbi:FGFR1 oncogene partner isoform X7 [Electrophorus electricus]|uniref:Centrosomal protein 43 n=1 Tax=Electrophorus electricus TaxID=8005 RepID=A0A4W4F7F7_ELEEL|nr:FGFR1 oncogene partner isoform X7 [Electrophorus electricus]